MEAPEEKIAVAQLSVFSNTVLVALKLVLGILMGSVAVISEAVHSGMDLLAALMARFSVAMSAEPADEEHHFGHGKYENLSGMVEGILIFLAAGWIIYEAARRLFGREGEVGLIGAGIAVMAVSMILNLYVGTKLRKVAKKTDSLALEADAYHLLTDVWTSVGVIVALVLMHFTGYQWLDPIVAIFVALLIIRTAFGITKRSTEGLLDKSLPDSELRLIESVIRSHESDVLNFHKLRARKMGSDRQIDLHLVVPRYQSVKQSHDLVDELEEEIKVALMHASVVVHIEPCDARCEKCKMAPYAPSGQIQKVPDETSDCRLKK
ncbi:MAG: cation transporter [Candidatus Thermoplasmatota archaeon]|nr:cation transporter [Candidatus Thermoplasmatota archaeon]